MYNNMKKYSCVCLKCNTSFESEDEADFDGEAFCPNCKGAKKKIAAEVDAKIAMRRQSKEPVESHNILQEIRKRPKGSTTFMDKGGNIR